MVAFKGFSWAAKAPRGMGRELQVERLLDTVDAVIYLLDYSKLKTEEEALLLQRLKVS